MAFNYEEPPPSTLAAHILRNGAGPPTQREPVTGDNFDKLLAEFLRDPVVLVGEEQLDDNNNFVRYMVDAALEYRKTSEPFTPSRNIEQTAGCLQCIRYTVDKHPEVLQFNGTDCFVQSPQPPLALTLTAKILFLAAKEGINLVWDGLVEVLSRCVSAQLTRPTTWPVGVAFGRLLDATLEGWCKPHSCNSTDQVQALLMSLKQ
jgi:serine/threonine-protein kinase ATR